MNKWKMEIKRAASSRFISHLRRRFMAIHIRQALYYIHICGTLSLYRAPVIESLYRTTRITCELISTDINNE